MKNLRNGIIRAGLEALYLTGAHHVLKPLFAGIGTIFMLHHVRPPRDLAFQPNAGLEITPEFLRKTLAHIRAMDIDIITLDEMHERLVAGRHDRRFACFTFDDGYRDNRDHALPIMRDYQAPFTVFVTSSFADGVGRLWWVALERLVASKETIEAPINGTLVALDASTPQAKAATFSTLHDWLRGMTTNWESQRAMTDLCHRHGIDEEAIARELCLSWPELRRFAGDPLVTVGAHTVTHCNIAKASAGEAEHELVESRRRIERELEQPALHLAYPYGDRSAAAARDFVLARNAGFKTAVTTRPGMIFAENAEHLTALPRLSLNGNYQSERLLPVLTSGAATAMWNGFRRVNAA